MSTDSVAKLVPGRPFKPGQRGGPGRQKGIVSLIRELTRDGADMVELFVEVMRDKKSSKKDRMEAAKWLKEHGFGKAPEISLTGTLGADEQASVTQALADSELEAMARVLKEQNNSTATVVPLLTSTPKSPELLKKPTD